MRSIAIPAIGNEDRLPHHAAVWREPPAPAGDPEKQISVEYGDSSIEQTIVRQACWPRVNRWRYGWAPRA